LTLGKKKYCLTLNTLFYHIFFAKTSIFREKLLFEMV